MENKLLENLEQAVKDGDDISAKKLAEDVLQSNINPIDAVESLSKGMRFIGEQFAKEEIALPEVMLSSEAMKVGLGILEPYIKLESRETLGKVVIGTVQADIHDIGKSIVSAMLRAAGFEVHDLGKDIPANEFVNEFISTNANIVASSAMMSTTMYQQQKIETELEKSNIRHKVKTIVGGSPTSIRWAQSIGADGWAINASEAIIKVKELISI
jgi:trimethylamine corrinoid protein